MSSRDKDRELRAAITTAVQALILASESLGTCAEAFDDPHMDAAAIVCRRVSARLATAAGIAAPDSTSDVLDALLAEGRRK